MRSRRITSLALSTLAVTGGLAAVQPGAAHAVTGSGAVTPTFKANDFQVQADLSAMSGSTNLDFPTPIVTTFSTVGKAPHGVKVTSSDGTWGVELAATANHALAVGTYTGTTDISTPSTPGLLFFATAMGATV